MSPVPFGQGAVLKYRLPLDFGTHSKASIIQSDTIALAWLLRLLISTGKYRLACTGVPFSRYWHGSAG
jgi:hypothetical protein